MEAFVNANTLSTLAEFIRVAKKNPKVEIECKLLSGLIQTKDVVDRIIQAAEELSFRTKEEEPYLTVSYPDNTRVVVEGVQNVHKVCTTNSFRGIPVRVEKKERYGGKDVVEASELSSKFTLRTETFIKNDSDANPNDPKGFIRLISRKSYVSHSQLFQIDVSMVKSKEVKSGIRTVRDVLKQSAKYEVEIEFIDKSSTLDEPEIVKELLAIITRLSQAYYQTPFLLPASDIQRYQEEFRASGHSFYNLITMLRKHIKPDNPHNITEGYTVTNKADGERSGLYVARDKKVLKITNVGRVTWTGITANSNTHIGDFVDGEYIVDKNLFCIFDVYRFRNKDVRDLPLMTTDDDITLTSRLGCAKLFVDDLKTEFTMQPTLTPMRIETKLFLAGDGPAMEEAITRMLSTEFEYKIDGLIFTPRKSRVAPPEDRRGNTWVRVYKWKPASQNSIDFLIRISDEEMFDPVLRKQVKKGELYVSRNAGDDIIYPRETMNGEYTPRALPTELKRLGATNTRVPSIFQPSVPQDQDAYIIYLPIDESKRVPLDEEGHKIESNTIVECSFDIETRRWTVMRTRYDKTYQYRVMHEPQYGNDIVTANSNWTSMHVAISEDMLKSCFSQPIDDAMEDDMYYRDDLKRSTRILKDVYAFHNSIKYEMYKNNLKEGDTLLELASGVGGDLFKAMEQRPSKIVGLDYSLSNIISPIRGSAVRYIKQQRENPQIRLPPTLFVQGDMTVHPLFEQEDKYMPILNGTQQGSTNYLKQFEGLKQFDTISCQFALHYACQTEETFKAFAQNLKDSGKGLFFGTCSDGQQIYSLLLGKQQHLFGSRNEKTGEYAEAGKYVKQYSETGNWDTDQAFGMGVSVLLESFEVPQVEYLVPFDKVVDILAEHGFELVESKLFSELYDSQRKIVLTDEQKLFSFLNRSFIFRRTEVEEPEAVQSTPVEEDEEEEEEEEEEEYDEDEDEGGKRKEEVKTVVAETPVKKTRKLRKKEVEKEPEPILFFGADESKGSYRNFSNMSEHPVTIEGVKYPTVEHYFQAMKAKEFGDTDVYDRIVKSKTPKAAKALGRKVSNFVVETWEAKRDDIMEKAVRTKFVQHPSLRTQLMETGDKVIGEANPRDTYWGIGTSMNLEKAKYPSKWRGKNMLGKLLMKLRDDFNKEAST